MSKAFLYFGDTIYNKDEAGKVMNYFAMLSLDCMKKMTSEIREFIYHELLEKSGEILSVYLEQLKKVDESVMEIPLYFCTKEYMERELTNMVCDVEKWSSYAFIINTVDEIGIVEHKSHSYYEKNWKDDYVEKTEVIEKFSIDTLTLHRRMITVLNGIFDKYIQDLCFDARNQLHNMKTQFFKNLNSVKQFIKQKEEELKQCEIDQLRMNEEKQKNKKLLNWIESRINEINRILDI